MEDEVYLMEMLLINELIAAAELGLIPINSRTELPEALDGEFVGLITEIVFDCLG